MTEKTEAAASNDPPRKVSDEDRLAVENCYLKVMNYDHQRKALQENILKIEGFIKEQTEKLQELSKQYQVKYGIVLGRDQIAPDGTIISKTPEEQAAEIQKHVKKAV